MFKTACVKIRKLLFLQHNLNHRYRHGENYGAELKHSGVLVVLS
jgi:hypothetical protein